MFNNFSFSLRFFVISSGKFNTLHVICRQGALRNATRRNFEWRPRRFSVGIIVAADRLLLDANYRFRGDDVLHSKYYIYKFNRAKPHKFSGYNVHNKFRDTIRAKFIDVFVGIREISGGDDSMLKRLLQRATFSEGVSKFRRITCLTAEMMDVYSRFFKNRSIPLAEGIWRIFGQRHVIPLLIYLPSNTNRNNLEKQRSLSEILKWLEHSNLKNMTRANSFYSQ